MHPDNQRTHGPPTQPTRRAYSTPRLEPLGGVAQVTAGPVSGKSGDGNSGMGMS
jgi:hypothetical protein